LTYAAGPLGLLVAGPLTRRRRAEGHVPDAGGCRSCWSASSHAGLPSLRELDRRTGVRCRSRAVGSGVDVFGRSDRRAARRDGGHRPPPSPRDTAKTAHSTRRPANRCRLVRTRRTEEVQDGAAVGHRESGAGRAPWSRHRPVRAGDRAGQRHRAVDGEDARHHHRPGHPHRGMPARAVQRRGEASRRRGTACGTHPTRRRSRSAASAATSPPMPAGCAA